MRYQVQFKSSGIVATTMPSKALAEQWVEVNGTVPDTDYYDPITGEIVPERVIKGQSLNLFTIVRVK